MKPKLLHTNWDIIFQDVLPGKNALCFVYVCFSFTVLALGSLYYLDMKDSYVIFQCGRYVQQEEYQNWQFKAPSCGQISY